MKMSKVTQGLLQDLASAARDVDPAEAERVERVLRLAAGNLSVRLLGLATELADELSSVLPGGRLEVRLASADELEFVYADESPAQPPADDGEQARMTLRLPQSLKDRAEQAADDAGLSLNAWIVHELGEAVGRRPGRGGRRMKGFGRA